MATTQPDRHQMTAADEDLPTMDQARAWLRAHGWVPHFDGAVGQLWSPEGKTLPAEPVRYTAHDPEVTVRQVDRIASAFNMEPEQVTAEMAAIEAGQ